MSIQQAARIPEPLHGQAISAAAARGPYPAVDAPHQPENSRLTAASGVNNLQARISAFQSSETDSSIASLQGELAELRDEIATLSECFCHMLDLLGEQANNRVDAGNLVLLSDRVGLMERRLHDLERGPVPPPLRA